MRASVGSRGNLANTSDIDSKLKGDILESSKQWVENFTPEFRAFIDSKYQWEQSDYETNRECFIDSKIWQSSQAEVFLSDVVGCQAESKGVNKALMTDNKRRLPQKHKKTRFILTPEAIMGYIYAILFHKDYRERYLDFLKIDFPKIPFVESKELFLKLSKLGQELISVHLMADNERERERDGAARE